jgi:hypothetical protein
MFNFKLLEIDAVPGPSRFLGLAAVFLLLFLGAPSCCHRSSSGAAILPDSSVLLRWTRCTPGIADSSNRPRIPHQHFVPDALRHVARKEVGRAGASPPRDVLSGAGGRHALLV